MGERVRARAVKANNILYIVLVITEIYDFEC